MFPEAVYDDLDEDHDDDDDGGGSGAYDSPPDADATKDTSKEHLCPECGKVFKSQKLLKYHINEHEGRTPYKCDHPGCDFRSASKFKVRGHKKIKHWTEENHLKVGGVWYEQCKLCPEVRLAIGL